jgi:putative inorganic carbon (HCO3(-)) transporter
MMSPQWLVWGFAKQVPWSMIVGGVTLAGMLFTRERKSIPWNTELVLMVTLLAYFTFTTLFAWAPDVAWEKWKLVMKVVVMVILATTVIYGKDRIRWLLIVIALGVGFYGIKGGIWSILNGGIYSVQGPEGGFMTMNNGIGIGLLMVVPIMLALAREHSQRWKRWGFGIAAGLSTISIVFSYSRGAWLGLAASAYFTFLRSKKKFLIALAMAPVIFVGFLFVPDKVFDRAETIGTYKKDNSAMQRLHTWKVAWNIAVESPTTGAGFDFDYHPNANRWFSYGDPDIREHMDLVQSAHSIYFQVLGQHGFVAFGIYVFLLLSTLWKCKRLAKRAADHPNLDWISNYAWAIRTSLIGYMVSGAFVSVAYFDLAWVYYSFTAILGRELADYAGTTREVTSVRATPTGQADLADQSAVGSAFSNKANV